MNLLLLDEADRKNGRFEIADARATHVREVLRARIGETVRVGLVNGPLGSGEVVAMDDRCVALACTFESTPPPRPLFDLVLAIARPKSLRKLLPEVAAFGVDRIVLLRTWRVAKPYLTASVLQPEALDLLLRDGMMQGRHTHLPHVQVEPLFKPFVDGRMDKLFSTVDRRIIAHPGARKSIAELRMEPRDRVVGVIGPEGGLLPYEVASFEEHGFQAVRLGDSPLRVETACVALMAQVALLRMLTR